jgi:hypothetical protein
MNGFMFELITYVSASLNAPIPSTWLNRATSRTEPFCCPDGHAHALDRALGPPLLTDEELAAVVRARAGAVPGRASPAG